MPGGSWIENKWMNGQSFDPILGLDGSFQYSNNIDTRNELGLFQLSPKEESATMLRVYCYLVYSATQLIRMTRENNEIKVHSGSNSTHALGALIQTIVSTNPPLNACVFQGDIYIFTRDDIFKLDMTLLTTANITPALWFTGGVPFMMPTLNFHQTFLVVGNQFKLWRLDPILGFILGREVIRDFGQGNIVGITGYDSQFGVTVNHNGVDSRTYILGGNFDADDIGILGEISTMGISPRSTTQIGNRLFYFAQDRVDSMMSTLYEIIGTNPIKLWRGKLSSGDTGYIDDFILSDQAETATKMNQGYPQKDKIIYIPTNDGIWTYGAKNENMIPAMERTFDFAAPNSKPLQSIIFGDYLYVSKDGSESRFNLAYRNQGYTGGGTLISRVYTGSARGLKKTNKKLFITYWMPDIPNASIRVSLRRNREGFNTVDGWQTVVTLTQVDAFKMPGVRQMRKEISLTSSSDFKMDRNTLEYKVEIGTPEGGQISPEFLEFYLLYDYIQL